MWNKACGYVSIFASVLVVGFCGCIAAQDASPGTSGQPLPEPQKELTRDELIAIYTGELARLGLQPSPQDKPPRFREKLDWGFSEMASMEGSVSMFIDLKTGEVRAMQILSKKYPWRDERDYRSDFSLEEAEKIANKHLSLINVHVKRYLPTPQDQLHMRKLRYYPINNSWRAIYQKTYKGYPVDSYISIDFLGDGTFYAFSSSLVIVDCPTEVRIPLDKARAAAEIATVKIRLLHQIWGRIGRECVYNSLGVSPESPWSYQEGGALEIVGANPILKGPWAYQRYMEKPPPPVYR
ncbi:MAG TPA: hypothetical protein ENN09_06790, partial [Planctomycetes bacterium]|nr:hypothetical protein [Planctomycetota bacterium]